jgi:hypothetical protein
MLQSLVQPSDDQGCNLIGRLAGLGPAISLGEALCSPERDARDKRGHDG